MATRPRIAPVESIAPPKESGFATENVGPHWPTPRYRAGVEPGRAVRRAVFLPSCLQHENTLSFHVPPPDVRDVRDVRKLSSGVINSALRAFGRGDGLDLHTVFNRGPVLDLVDHPRSSGLAEPKNALRRHSAILDVLPNLLWADKSVELIGKL